MRTSVSGNFAVDSGGGIFTAGHTLISSSTVSDNRTDFGGGVFSIGTVILRDDTVADNRALSGGGGIGSFGTARLNSVTVARNIADSDGSGGAAGGGLSILGGTVAVSNSLIALNTVGAGSTDPNCSGGFDSGGHNLRTTSDPGCAGFTAAGDFVSSNPKIGFLANNGGPTQTIALQSGSPAIGHADSATAATRDQRGVLRDSHPDIGAFER